MHHSISPVIIPMVPILARAFRLHIGSSWMPLLAGTLALPYPFPRCHLVSAIPFLTLLHLPRWCILGQRVLFWSGFDSLNPRKSLFLRILSWHADCTSQHEPRIPMEWSDRRCVLTNSP